QCDQSLFGESQPHWPRRTNLWREVTSPATGTMRPRRNPTGNRRSPPTRAILPNKKEYLKCVNSLWRWPSWLGWQQRFRPRTLVRSARPPAWESVLHHLSLIYSVLRTRFRLADFVWRLAPVVLVRGLLPRAKCESKSWALPAAATNRKNENFSNTPRVFRSYIIFARVIRDQGVGSVQVAQGVAIPCPRGPSAPSSPSVSLCKCVWQAQARHATTLPASQHVGLRFCRGFDGKLGRRSQNHLSPPSLRLRTADAHRLDRRLPLNAAR